MTLIREIIKDMEDWKGDNTFGCKTLPIIWGIRRTKLLLYLLLGLFAGLVLLVNQLYVGLPIYYFVFFLFLPKGYLLARLIRADTTRDFARLSSLCKLILVLGIVSMALI
jgi:4-hydroxybenzoate polyprenyltransferase